MLDFLINNLNQIVMIKVFQFIIGWISIIIFVIFFTLFRILFYLCTGKWINNPLDNNEPEDIVGEDIWRIMTFK